MGELLPEQLGDVGHKRVEEPQAGVEDVDQDPPIKYSRWVGGWVEEDEAVRMRCCML